MGDPNEMEILYNARFRIVGWGKDVGDDTVLHLKLRCPNTGTYIELHDLPIRKDTDQYKRLRQAYEKDEHIQLWLTTDFLKETPHDIWFREKENIGQE